MAVKLDANSCQKFASYTPLQKHVAFFDRNGDGTIKFEETVQGLEKLGIQDGFERKKAAAIIHLGLGDHKLFGKLTGGAKDLVGAMLRGEQNEAVINRAIKGLDIVEMPTISVDSIASKKHGSDSDIYKDDGTLNMSRFNEIFSKPDIVTVVDGKKYITAKGFENLRKGNAETLDLKGKFAAKGEFDLLQKAVPESVVINGQPTQVISVENMEKFYRGDLFYSDAGEVAPWNSPQCKADGK